MLKNVVPVLGSKIGCVQAYSEGICHALSVSKVLFCRAVFGSVVLVPVLHEQTFDLVSLLLKQQSGNRRIDAARHTDDHFGSVVIIHRLRTRFKDTAVFSKY